MLELGVGLRMEGLRDVEGWKAGILGLGKESMVAE